MKTAANFSARYYGLLGAVPTSGRAEAVAFHVRVLEVIELGGMDGTKWSHTELTSLRRLERRWAARASGDDLRYSLVGGRAGRLTSTQESQLKPPADPAWGNDE